MNQVFHAHELLHLLMAADSPISEDALRIKANQRFGENAYFTNCTGRLYSFDEIMDFLTSRNKVLVRDGGIYVITHNVCDHD
ncbi:MAG: DUF2492 family protein [Fidelibacterota bacterium]|nr:MAG: DUF2492 family protein [Candidatus Neomarinimicrobiota bacterium]